MKVLDRNLIFVSGKGGVGKTRVSQAIAQALSERSGGGRGHGRKTLWCTFEDPTRMGEGEAGKIVAHGPNLSHLNVEGGAAFEEYAAMKIGGSRLTRVFVQNRVIQYLFQAAPGIHELVVLGKVWYESQNFDHVVVDMPSTGYGLAMFQSTINFLNLFNGGGPLQKDAVEMLDTFRDPRRTGHLIVALPEEMPLRESLELGELLRGMFPDNPAEYLVNRRFPRIASSIDAANRETPDEWATPFAASAADYCRKRSELEAFNLRIWESEKLKFAELPFVPPAPELTPDRLVARLAGELVERGYV